MRAVLTVLTILAVPTVLRAQSSSAGQSGPRTLLPRDQEISLARSAAPASVSDSAAVYVLSAAGWRLAVAGSNGAACIVSRTWVESLEPVCYDEEGAATSMAVEMHRIELLHRGISKDSVDRAVAAGMASGRFRLPMRPAMSYMMSSAQRLIGDDGRPVGRWQPHLMIDYPYLTERDLGLAAGGEPSSLMVSDPGKPTARMIIVLKTFVDPR